MIENDNFNEIKKITPKSRNGFSVIINEKA
jgi:hypothetical protein